MTSASTNNATLGVLVVTSIHKDFDARIWRHCTSISERGYAVGLIAPWEKSAELNASGVDLISFTRVNGRFPRLFLVPLRVLPRILVNMHRYRIVHFHDIDLLPWMALVSFFKPVVYDVHENYPEEMLTREWVPNRLRVFLFWFVKILQWLLASIIRNIVICVPSQIRHFRGKRFRRCVLRNYSSQKIASSSTVFVSNEFKTKTVKVVFSGGHYESNGSLLLLEIAKLVRKRNNTVQFIVIDRFADRDFKQLFFATRDQFGLKNNVLIEPPVPAPLIAELLAKGDIAIAPNLRILKQELAIPTKLFEYMAVGLPIVSSDLPYPKKLLNRCHCGILAQPEEPESFADAICELASNSDLRRRYGQVGRQGFLDHYTWESQVPRLLQFYDEIVSG